MKKRIISLLLSLAMCFSLLPGVTLFAAAAAGEGAATVVTDANLDVILENMNGSYVLGDNITVTEPIGSLENPFNGTFDGGDHTVTLAITSTSAANYQGLFAALGTGAVVKNVTVEGSVSGLGYVGGIAGYNNGGTVENCHNKATVEGSNTAIGGIVGHSVGGTVTGCTNSGPISNIGGNNDDSSTAGIVGKCAGGLEVINCGNSGPITVEVTSIGTKGASAAGVVGNLEYSTITSCYNTGNLVSNGPALGGILGYGVGATIVNCYNTGAITGNDNGNASTSMRIAGIAGHLGGTGQAKASTVSGCYTTGEVVNLASDDPGRLGGIVGKVNNGYTSLTCCYYSAPNQAAAVASGNPKMNDVGTVTAEQLASGELAWKLRNNSEDKATWGQKVGTDGQPYLIAFPQTGNASDHPVVSRVSFYTPNSSGSGYNTSPATAPIYVNPGYSAKVPPITLTAPAGYELLWFRSPTDRTKDTEVELAHNVSAENEDCDLSLYAAYRVLFGVTGANKTITLTYGERKTQDISAWLAYADANVGITGNFTYAIKATDDKATLGATGSGDTLIIPATAPGGTYSLTLTATEKEYRTVLAPTPTTVAGTYTDSTVTTLTYGVVVGKKTLTPVISGNTTKTYDGNPNIALTLTLEGVVNGDEVTLTGTGFAFRDANAGPDKSIDVTVGTLDENSARNYTVTAPAPITGTINRATVKFTVEDYIKYYAVFKDPELQKTDADSTLEATVKNNLGLEEGKDYVITYKHGDDDNLDPNSDTPEPVGDKDTNFPYVYELYVTLKSDNYQLQNSEHTTVVAGSNNLKARLRDLTVNQHHLAGIEITMDPADGTVEYNGTNQKPTVTVTDSARDGYNEDAPYTLVEGTDYDAITSASVGGTLANSDFTNVGKYDITIQGRPGTAYATGSRVITFAITAIDLSKSGNGVAITCTDSATYNGDPQKPEVTVKWNNKELVKDTDYTVTYQDSTGKPVTSMKNVDDYTVVITGMGNFTGVVEKTFTINKADMGNATTQMKVEFDIGTMGVLDYDGRAHRPTVTVQMRNPEGDGYRTVSAGSYDVSWGADQSIYNGGGFVAAKTYTVTITAKDNSNYSGAKTATFTIKPADISTATVTLSSTTTVYNGAEQKPTVTVQMGGKTLVKDIDYTIDWGTGDYTKVAAYSVNVAGKGNYDGRPTAGATFNITQAPLTAYIGGETTKVYDGTTNVPDATVELDGVMNDDDVSVDTYSIAYNSKNVDEAIIITATDISLIGDDLGNYTLESTTAEADGAITKLPVRFVVTGRSVVYDGKEKTATVTPDSPLLQDQEDTYYRVTYRKDGQTVEPKDEGEYEIWVTLMGGAENNFQFDTSSPYVDEDTVDENTTEAKVNTLNIQKLSLAEATVTVEANPSDVVYNGKSHRGEVTVTVTLENGTELTSDDYDVLTGIQEDGADTLTGATPINAGAYTVVVVGKGSYAGQVTATNKFTVKPADLKGATVTAADLTYTGKELTPKVAVTLDGFNDTTLTANDYTVSIDPPQVQDVGPYTVTVKGKNNDSLTGTGNFKDTATGSFNVVKINLSKATVTLDPASAPYRGTAYTPTVKVTLNGKVVPDAAYTPPIWTKDGEDFSGDLINAGTYTVTVTAENDSVYTGEKSATFRITPVDLSSAVVTLSATEATADGNAHKPEVTSVILNGTPLTEGTDYTIDWGSGDYTAAGTYTVSVEGKDNYTGTATATFQIKSATPEPGPTPDRPSTRPSGTTSQTTYPPEVEENTKHGSLSSSNPNPKKGDKVTVTPNPNQGYTVGKVVARDQEGNEIELIDNGDGTFTFVQPEGTVTIDVEYECTHQEFCPVHSYRDSDVDAWYHDGIHYAVEEGLMQGFGDGVFGPTEPLSRAQLAQILFNQSGGVPVNYLMDYDDVPADEWFAEAIRWASSEGVVTGYGDTFGPNDSITREQFAVMLYRYAQKLGHDMTVEEDALARFADAADCSEWAYEAMAWAVQVGVITGYDSGVIAPQGNAIRAEAATMLMRFFQEHK